MHHCNVSGYVVPAVIVSWQLHHYGHAQMAVLMMEEPVHHCSPADARRPVLAVGFSRMAAPEVSGEQLVITSGKLTAFIIDCWWGFFCWVCPLCQMKLGL